MHFNCRISDEEAIRLHLYSTSSLAQHRETHHLASSEILFAPDPSLCPIFLSSLAPFLFLSHSFCCFPASSIHFPMKRISTLPRHSFAPASRTGEYIIRNPQPLTHFAIHLGYRPRAWAGEALQGGGHDGADPGDAASPRDLHLCWRHRDKGGRHDANHSRVRTRQGSA